MAKAEQFKGARNQLVITDERGAVLTFQSYKTFIAKIFCDGRVVLDHKCLDYSRTTSKYLYKFLNDTRDGIKRKIKTGQYELADLN